MFQIKLFGSFRMTKDEQILDEGTLKSHMLMKLLIYILVQHDRPVTNSELEEYLWEQGTVKGKDALKNLICRLRVVLEKNFDIKDFILSGRGYYKCNPKYELVIDTEQFKSLCEKIRNSPYTDINKRNKDMQTAVNIYDGMYLSNNKDRYIDNHDILEYHAMYIYLVEQLCDNYWENGENEALELLCNKALSIDTFDEKANIYKTKLLIRQNKFALAQMHYHNLERMVKLNSDIQQTKLLELVRNEVVSASRGESLSLAQIQNEVISKEAESMEIGAYMCTYNEFQSICILQKRNDKRSKSESYIILVSFDIKKEYHTNAEVTDFLVNHSIENMYNILKNMLRACDVVCQCSRSQFVILLYESNYAGSLVVANKIKDRFEQISTTQFTDIDIDIEKLHN